MYVWSCISLSPFCKTAQNKWFISSLFFLSSETSRMAERLSVEFDWFVSAPIEMRHEMSAANGKRSVDCARNTMAAALHYRWRHIGERVNVWGKMAKVMLTLCMIFVASLKSSLSDDGHEMEEFLKREYSLSKPYQGRSRCHASCPFI